MSLQNRNALAAREDTKENVRPRQNQKAGNSRRPALGNVTNVRRQPQRIAKGRHSVLQNSKSNFGGQENEVPIEAQGKKAGGSQGMGFAIFEDVGQPMAPEAQVHEDIPMQDQENLIPEQNLLHDAVVGLNGYGNLPRPHIPLAPLHVDVDPPQADSPMLIDEAVIENAKKRESRLERPDEFGLDPYFLDIYQYLRATELVYRPDRHYMNKQTDVTTSMRNILVDWLVEVGEEYKLHRETLFLAICYIDRFLSLVGVHRPKLQLVGAASMFIAAKYEEIYPPDVAEFVYITDDTYSRSQVLKMESVILKLLEFRVAIPTVNWFTERFLNVIEMSDKCKFLTHFLTELSLIEIEDLLAFRPSIIAASAIVLARSTLNENQPWPDILESVTGYSLEALKKCVHTLFRLYNRMAHMPQQAVVEKYKQEKFCRVAHIEPPRFLAIY